MNENTIVAIIAAFAFTYWVYYVLSENITLSNDRLSALEYRAKQAGI